MEHNGSAINDDQEKAEVLNSFFAECFNSSLPSLSSGENFCSNEEDDVCPDDFLCYEEEVLELLQSIDTTKANGPDGISGTMLKATAYAIFPSVTALFNKSIRSGIVPTKWKEANVTPIPKGSNTSSVSNYRPISLLSVLSKLLERHMHSLIHRYLMTYHPLAIQQWGFQPHKSTVSALLDATHKWSNFLDKGLEVVVVCFDLKKAFDSVPHRALIDKMKSIGLHPYLVRWTANYLTGRSQRVVLNGSSSSLLPVISDVPQGSVLGPLLFLIYIDGCANTPLNSDNDVTLYADDLSLFRPIRSPEDYDRLQEDINNLATWVTASLLTFNAMKCKYLLLSRRRSHAVIPQLYLSETPLVRVFKYKYLGVIFTADLSWSEHIQSISSKAKRLLGVLYRQFYRYSSGLTLATLYKSLVRPHLEYASPVWNPYLDKDIELLESVQKMALKICTKNWNSSYEENLAIVSLTSLAQRRDHLSLCYFYKLVHNLFCFPEAPLIPYTHTKFTRAGSKKLFVPMYQPFSISILCRLICSNKLYIVYHG